MSKRKLTTSSSGSDDDPDHEGPKYRTDRRVCLHCNQSLSLKTYRFHKRLFFDQTKGQWLPSNDPAEGDPVEEDSLEHVSDEVPPDSPLNFTLVPDQTWSPCSLPNSPSLFHTDELSTDSGQSEPEEAVHEIWDDAETNVLADLDDEEPEDIDGEMETASNISNTSAILSRWFIHFMFFMQSVFHLSDQVITFFLGFFRMFFKYCSTDLGQYLPTSLYTARKLYNKPMFRKYVVCKKCHRIYNLSDCIENCHSKACSFRRFPSHPQISRRQPCGSLLFKTVEMTSGSTHFYPFMTYSYMSLETSLQLLLNRPNFLQNCEEWRKRTSSEGILRDVYDGRMWENFLNYDDQPFLSESGNFALILNMDFFQPFKHVQYSVGAIYVNVLNLSRDIRYKQENTILIGLIPGPSEPKRDINSFLDPFVDELLKFWDGIELNVYGAGRKKIRCALICVACDIPAGRKVCGFLGHNARLGCSRCFKEFTGMVGSTDYSGFDRDTWQLRNGAEHCKVACELLKVNTMSALQKAESEHGCRYSVLLKLPYFDAPRMLIVDPMHNLFLGSAKHFLNILINCSLISDSHFDLIQQRIDSFVVPSDIGRIPHKIRSGFSSFTADQWKNWVVYYSLIALRDILSNENFECWRHFVLACRVLSSKKLSLEQVKLGDALLVQFCRRTERIFGRGCITPNMHMHCHLSACILDYGPLHGFWLYAFERYNGILSSMPTNNRSIEIQLMTRFLRDNQILSLSLPEQFANDFFPLFPKSEVTGSISDTLSRIDHQAPCYNIIDVDIKLPNHCSRHVLTSTQSHSLVELYTDLFSISRSCLSMSSIFMQYSSAIVNGKQLGTYRNKTGSSSIVMAKWDSGFFGGSSSVTRAARIDHLCKHVITVADQTKTILLVSISWFKYHPKNTTFGKPITVWYGDLFEADGIHSLIPVQFIICRCVSLVDKLDGESVLYVCPCIDY